MVVLIDTNVVIDYIVSREPFYQAASAVLKACAEGILRITGASHQEVVSAIQDESMPDFEDCLQDKCAQCVFADYIITRNPEDFRNAKTAIISPQVFANLVSEKST